MTDGINTGKNFLNGFRKDLLMLRSFIFILTAVLVIPLYFGCASNPPLIKAAYEGDLNRTEALLKGGLDINMKGGDWNETALSAAAAQGHIDLVEFLLDNGADVDLLSGNGDSALLLAAYRCHSDIAMLLLSNGADASFLNPNTGSSPLLHAVECEDIDLVKTLIENGADTNLQTQSGRSLLLPAVRADNLALAKVLIENGANANYQDKSGFSPLVAAAWNNNAKMADLLINAGSSIDAMMVGGGSALYEAAFHGHDPMVALLIEKGADVNLTSHSYGRSPLLAAVSENHSNTAFMLIEAGADIEAKDQSGFNPLLYAAYNGNALIAKQLCEKGANINIQVSDGWTPIQFAISYEYEDVVAILMLHNADVDIKNQKGRDARWYAQKSRNKNILRMVNDPDPEFLAAYAKNIYTATPAITGNRIDNATIERVRTAKPLNVSYRNIVFNDFTISDRLKKSYPHAAAHCKEGIMHHLREAGAFGHVSNTSAPSQPGETCIVDGVIEDMYISSKVTRLLFGPISKIPFMTVRIKLTDSQSKEIFHEMVISTDTAIYWTRVTVGDIDAFIPKEVGKIIGEYINTVLPAHTPGELPERRTKRMDS